MATINYRVIGTFRPFMVLLKDSLTNDTITSAVIQESNVLQQFIDVPVGNYNIVAYDTANASAVSDNIIITPTTTTTTTTTLAPTTTTITTTTITTTTSTTLPPPPVLIAVGGSPNSLIYKSTDSGVSWSKIIDQGGNSLFLESVSFFDTQTGIAVGGGGTVWRTTNAGDSWALIGEFNGTPIHPNATNTFRSSYSSSINNMYIGGNGDSLFVTNNSGISWNETPASGGLSQLSQGIYAFNSTNAVSVSSLGTQRIIKTTNGSSWSTVFGTLVGFQDVNFFGSSTTSAVGFAVGNSGDILKSTDSGSNWVIPNGLVPAPGGRVTFFRKVKMITSDITYLMGIRNAVTSGSEISLFKTFDGGDSWNDISSNLGSTVGETGNSMDWENEDNGWIATAGGKIYRTTDGGLTWNSSNVPNPSGSIFDIKVLI